MAVHLPVTLDRTSSVPLYLQLAEQLLAGIHAGRVNPGDRFENELDLAEQLNLYRPRIAKPSPNWQQAAACSCAAAVSAPSSRRGWSSAAASYLPCRTSSPPNTAPPTPK